MKSQEKFTCQGLPIMNMVDAAFDSMFSRPANLALPHVTVIYGGVEYCVAGRNMRGGFWSDAIWRADDKRAINIIDDLPESAIEAMEMMALVAHQ